MKDFIRLESFVFGHIGDEGFTHSNAAETLRYRRQIGAENVKVLTDIKKKHSSHAITADVNIVDTAIAADFFLSGFSRLLGSDLKLILDGLILTGSHTGVAADVSELEAVKKAVDMQVWIGSGVTAKNIRDFSQADGLIIGSEFKKEGKWYNELDPDRILAITQKNANKESE